jgi:hypothetical protein
VTLTDARLERRELLLGLALVVVVAAVSMVLTMQGWKSRVTAFDLLTYVYSADQFLESGALPRHGDTGSYGSYKPPGTAWLMMPSRLLSDDPRLAEYAGTALLHLATLVGVFLLARRFFTTPVAAAAVVLYGLSTHGIFLAGSLWPNGRPDFYVWVALLTSYWVLRRDARLLAAAVGVCLVGMVVDMAIAPALFIFPVLWILYRPPVRPAPLVVAAVVVLIVWAPYLQFELGRGFADLRSQVLLQNVFPDESRSVWCDPDRTMLAVSDPADAGTEAGEPTASSPLVGSISLAISLKDKLLSNFDAATLIPGIGLALGLLVAAAALAYSVPGAGEPPGRSRSPSGRSPALSRRRVVLVGAMLVIVGVLLYLVPTAPVDYADPGSVPTTKKVALGLGLIGAVLVVLPGLVGAVDAWLSRRGITIQPAERAAERRILVACLLVPWVILFAVAEPGKPERFWWLWPLQVILLCALLFDLLPRLLPRGVAVAVGTAIAVCLAANPMLVSRLDAWRETGWAGVDAEEVVVVDYLASQVVADGADEAAIGYQTFIYPFMATYHVTNPVYKVGAELDMLFRYRHGIVNSNQCAEGLSDADEYRVVQTRRKAASWQPRDYFEAELEPQFRLLREFDLYQVWERAG